MLILNYLHVPAAVPLFPVCGLPLCCRAALEGRKNHQKVVLLVHRQDLPAVNTTLVDDERLQNTRTFSSAEELITSDIWQQTGEGEEILLLAADRVWSGNPLQGDAKAENGTVFLDHEGLTVMATTGKAHLKAESFDPAQATFPANIIPPNKQRHIRIDGVQWCRVATPAEIEHGEKHLLASLVKDTDGFISRHINRKISLYLTRHLMRTRITPNQITAVVLAIGICAGPAIIAMGGYGGILAGALLYYFSSVLDGCDGEISRLKFMGTPLGAWLDTVGDDIVGLSFLIGLYTVLFQRSPLWGWTGAFAIFFYLLTLVPRYYVLAVYLETGDYQKLAVAKHRPDDVKGLPRVIQFFEDSVFRIDFFSFSAVVTALFNFPELFASVYALGCMAAAIDSLIMFSHHRKQAMQKIQKGSG